ncbi:vitamin-K epoxide reductase [Leptinotarsa decemlineata]|uniref:vitamin-K epoxide reductase n=1 Tax=Leptinotarsa decemlineata TaxID=7539 RepID=UPI003D30D169
MWIISLSRINSLLTLSCLIGLGLSLYAYSVEIQIEKNDEYAPMCDINPHVSCTKAFKSEYGKGFGIFGKDSSLHQPNSLFGLMFYSMIATLAQSNSRFMVLVSLLGIVLSNIMSLYFAYILYFLLYDFCIVCVSIYVVNVINLILIHLKLKTISTIEENRTEKQKTN